MFMELRECKCKTHTGERLLPLSFFSKNKRKPDGIDTICNMCKKIVQQKWRRENQEKVKSYAKEYHKQWYESHKEEKLAKNAEWKENNKDQYKQSERNRYERDYAKMLWRGARERAVKKGIPFDIDVEDIVIPTVCPILGIQIYPGFRKENGNRFSDNSPSLDRIDNTKGYTKGNVMVISWRANRLKGNATIEELRMFCEYYNKKLGER